MLDPVVMIDLAKIVPKFGLAAIEAVTKPTSMVSKQLKTTRISSHLMTTIFPPRFGSGPPNKTVPTSPVSVSSCSSM